MAGEQIVATLKANPISVVCGAIALALGVGIYFRSDRVPDAEALLDQRASLGERLAANLQNGVQLEAQYAALAAARQQIEARLVRPDELAKNLQFFYKLEDETAIKLLDIRQTSVGGRAAAKAKGTYLSVGYAVSVRGSYPRLLDFLHRLESNQRFCRVVTAAVGVAGGSQSERNADLTLGLSIELLGAP